MKHTLNATVLIILSFGLASPLRADNSGFVTVNGTHFELNGQPYYYTGTNFWYGLNLGSDGPGGDRARLGRELDRFKANGITNLRIMAGSEGLDSELLRMVPTLQTEQGVYNPEVLDGLDYLLKEMGERNLHAVMCLNNFWSWSGGMAQYLEWNGSSSSTQTFYSNAGAMQYFRDFIDFIINDHVNRYTGLAYKDDPTIMAWELANEPRGYENEANFNIWIDETAAYIKSLDGNHLVTTGTEGETPWAEYNGMDFIANHDGPNIDYATCHIWPQNWGWFRPKYPSDYPGAEAQSIEYLQNHIEMADVNLNKPVVLEEFGLARDDGSYDPGSATAYRDLFYEAMFDEIYSSAYYGGAAAGDNFWAWAGEGRPLSPGGIWSPGDPWIGDPPHEFQGWYSVYDDDTSTLNVISDHAADMYALSPIPGDIELDRDVDFIDFAFFAEQWWTSGCGECGGADLSGDGDVDFEDLAGFAGGWMMER